MSHIPASSTIQRHSGLKRRIPDASTTYGGLQLAFVFNVSADFVGSARARLCSGTALEPVLRRLYVLVLVGDAPTGAACASRRSAAGCAADSEFTTAGSACVGVGCAGASGLRSVGAGAAFESAEAGRGRGAMLGAFTCGKALPL
ncbi:MAG TPA: hypothetical protein VIV60_01865, partial [Polyangiaceae bacterium]